MTRLFLQATAAFLVQAALNGLSVADLVVPARPDDAQGSTTFDAQVRTAGSDADWQPVPLYQVSVYEINSTTGSGKSYDSSVGYLDFDDSVEFSITPNASAYPEISSAVVRPFSYNIPATVSDGTITFTLSQPQNNVVLEINGDVFNVLHLWTNTVEQDPITEDEAAKDDNIIYYGPGFHSVSEGSITLNSSQTLYLASGAVVQSSVYIENATDVTIRGRGILYKPSNGAIEISYSDNVVVDGVSVMNPGAYTITAGSSKGIHVKGVRSVSAIGYGDGFDFFCCQDVLVENVFLRTSDDCIALYQHRNEFYGDSSNITVRDSSLWADVAHPINMGTHGNTEDPETMDGVTFSNIDILDQREPQIDYQGCIAFTVGDENLIQNVDISDIRVEDFRQGMLLSMRVVFNTKYNTGAGRGIKNVTITNLSYNGEGATTSFIGGYSPDRSVDFVTFRNLTVNGKQLSDDMEKPGWYMVSDYVPMIVAQHVNNVTYPAS
ncbi:putative transmembrane protein [Xylariomycetidae sp. FL0641]|nr:putative transmembrane protein [Xylariomycetidae sp. FL0641]